jgi:hypothetical protein
MNAIVPLSDIEKMASVAAASRMFGFKSKEEAMAIMLLCQAEGLHPAIAMRDYHVIQGRPTLKADAILARFQQAGGKVEWETLSDEAVSGTFSHAQGGRATITWTFADAQKIGLTGKENWKKYPRAMLRARVVSEGVRTVYPGVVVGVYTPEEVQDMGNIPRRGEELLPPVIAQQPEDESQESQGYWPVMLPGSEQPYTRVTTAEVWVMEMNDMASRIQNSSKLSVEDKTAKLLALHDANEEMIESLPEELRNGLVL